MRRAPFGWDRALTADECIATLQRERVEELSLDHDLHEEHYNPSLDPSKYRHKTGMAVVEWLILAEAKVWPTIIYVHSLNERGRSEMIEKLRESAPSHVQVIERKFGT
jgi:hypothetical protein